jgi:hypothetical protein
VRQALTGLPFLPSDIRQSLQGSDWTQTVYVPAGGNAKTVQVGDHEVLISEYHGSRRAIWLAHGYAYQLIGSVSRFPTEVSLLKAVEAISPLVQSLKRKARGGTPQNRLSP